MTPLRFLLSASLTSCARSHGWIEVPASRGKLGCDISAGYMCLSHQSTTPACDNLPCEGCERYPDKSHCSAGAYPGLATPDEPFCNPPGAGRNLNLTSPGAVQAQWTAGAVVEVTWAVDINHQGWYQYRLCLDGSDTEECFKRTPLKFEDGELWHWLDAACSRCEGKTTDKRDDSARLLMDRIVIPDGLQCDRCTLGWRWDAFDESSIFTGCADVSVSAGSSVSSVI